MKILRTLGLVLGALSCAAGFMSAAPISTNSVNTRPTTYKLFSSLQMFDTMKARKKLINWDCWVEYGSNPTPASGPASRTDAWLEGDFQSKADGVELWDVGAQHRTHQLLVRLVPHGSHTAGLKQVTDSMGVKLPTPVVPPQDANGFYLVEGSLPNGGTSPVNSYVIETSDPKLHLDVIYVGHEPGRATTRQAEDGGPPCIPPVNEN